MPYIVSILFAEVSTMWDDDELNGVDERREPLWWHRVLLLLLAIAVIVTPFMIVFGDR